MCSVLFSLEAGVFGQQQSRTSHTFTDLGKSAWLVFQLKLWQFAYHSYEMEIIPASPQSCGEATTHLRSRQGHKLWPVLQPHAPTTRRRLSSDDTPPGLLLPRRLGPSHATARSPAGSLTPLRRETPPPAASRPLARQSRGSPNGGGGAGPRVPCAVRRGLWRQCVRRVHGERLRLLSSGPRHRGAGVAKMSASLVRATVRAVSKRKLQPTRAALTLMSLVRPGTSG
ncbi:uncharacterized protein LOC123645714 [Lemur catta]|uniref:uncharacterized protein LOC123645714 n=1 Tax=Lemur catta TaxID=9447 RepID=UPI001E268C9C|nr:uncharacterized protein LOC123645714 [Lemur catta]